MPDGQGAYATVLAALKAAAKQVGASLAAPEEARGARYVLRDKSNQLHSFVTLNEVADFLYMQGVDVRWDEDGDVYVDDATRKSKADPGKSWLGRWTGTEFTEIRALPKWWDEEEEQQKPTAEYPTAAEAQAAIAGNPDLQAAGAQVEVTPKGTYKVTIPGEQPLAGPQFTVGEDGKVYRRDVAGGAWKEVEAPDIPSLDDEIDRLILEGTPEAMAEARRLYQAKQQVTGAAEASRQAAAEKQQAQAGQRFNQALQLVDLAQSDPARLDMVLKLLQQSGLWPFDGSMDPLQAVRQQVQQGPGFIEGFGTQAQRQAAAQQGIPLGQAGQVPTGFFGAGPEVQGELPVMLPGGIPETLAPEPGATATTLPSSPGVGTIPGGIGLPGAQARPSFEDAAAQFNQQLVTAMTSGQITEEQRNQAWQEFLKQWGKYPGASMGTTAGGLPITFGTGVSPSGQQNYQGGWVDVPSVGLVPEGAAKSYEAQQKELGALTPGSPYYSPINLDPAFLKQGTPISDLPFVQDVLGRQFKVSPQQEFTYLGGGPQAAGVPPTVTGNKFVDWLKVIQDESKQRARAEAQKANRLGQVFGRPVTGGSVRYG